MAVPHETIRGTIIYTSKKPERMDEERGREFITITKHGNGHRTLRAHAVIDDPPPVMRDAVLNYDNNWSPTDAFVRLTVDDQFVGSTWYRFNEELAECEGYTAAEGRIHQEFDLAGPITTLGSHPIQGDAWHPANYDLSQGPGQQSFPLFMTSFDHRGATGPMLLPRKELFITYAGDEQVTVGAGTFDAHHFIYGKNVGDTTVDPKVHPPYHVWCTNDGDYIFLKGSCGGYMMTYYELMELERVPGSS